MSPPPDEQRCQAFVQPRPDRGQAPGQCTRVALIGSRFCAIHEKSEAIETDPVRPLSAAKPNGWALEKRARECAEQVALAQREERERIEALEQSTITAGINAWGRLKRDTARLSDERLIGDALLAGRRRCMREVGADKPRGIKYVKANAAWLKETGFHEIQKSRRQTCMLIAENWVEFHAWKKTLPV